MITFAQYQQDRTIANRNILVKQNMGLVKKCANLIGARPGAELDDLMQVGYEVLIKRVERYDLKKNCTFATYAVPYIRGEMLHYIRDRSRLVRPPRKHHELIERSSKVTATSDTEIAQALEVTVDEWKQAKRSHRPCRSLEMRLSADSDTTLMDTIVVDSDLYAALVLDEMLATLPTKQRKIIELNFFDEMTQNKIGEILGNSHVTIARNKKQALRKLQNMAA